MRDVAPAHTRASRVRVLERWRLCNARLHGTAPLATTQPRPWLLDAPQCCCAGYIARPGQSCPVHFSRSRSNSSSSAAAGRLLQSTWPCRACCRPTTTTKPSYEHARRRHTAAAPAPASHGRLHTCCGTRCNTSPASHLTWLRGMRWVWLACGTMTSRSAHGRVPSLPSPRSRAMHQPSTFTTRANPFAAPNFL